MWPFKSVKSLKASGIFEGFTDWHSHILPGVDDGIKTLDDSLKVLEAYEQLGFRKVWLTPHVMEDYPNSRENLMPVFEELRNAWKGNVELALASENMLDTAFESNLRDNTFLPRQQYSSEAVSTAPYRLSRYISPLTYFAAYAPFKPNESG